MKFFEWLFRRVPRDNKPDIIIHSCESTLVGRSMQRRTTAEVDAAIDKLLGR